MNIALLLNLCVIPISLIGFYQAYQQVGKQIFIYYTEISNLIALLSSILYVLGIRISDLRYTAVCMLSMTALISLFVLSPMDGGIRKNMIEGNTLCHHTLVPLLTFISYVFFEVHSKAYYYPVLISLVYGLWMYYLNYKKKMEGPYPFFKIYEVGFKMAVVWLIILVAAILLISFGVIWIAG